MEIGKCDTGGRHDNIQMSAKKNKNKNKMKKGRNKLHVFKNLVVNKSSYQIKVSGDKAKTRRDLLGYNAVQ
jgi:transcriptional antiterminator